MKRALAGLFFIAAAALFPPTGTAQEQPPVYSNRDIEEYKLPSDSHPVEIKKRETREGRNMDARAAKDNLERERWCKRATAQKKKIEKTQYDVQTTEKALKREEERDFHGTKKSKQLRNKLEQEKRKFAAAEGEMNDIENEAHRKGVPPGWLRCQVD
jgi:DNA polymerase III alpha subunit (gram-positive type)